MKALQGLWLIGLLGCSLAAQGYSWDYETELLPPAAASNYGRAIALDGARALIGSNGAADLMMQPPEGSPLPPHLWLNLAHVTAWRSAPPGMFGAATALSGDWAAVGAPWGDAQLVNNGYVDLYQQQASGWSWQQRLIPVGFVPPPPFAPELEFGRTLAMAGTDLIVGARHYADTSGMVFVFQRIAGTYYQTQILQPDTDIFESSFGEILSLSGDTLAIARPGPGGSGVSTGSPLVAGEVHVYVRSAGGWILQQILTSPSSEPADYFGYGMDLAGDTLAVRDENGVHVFQRAAGVWNHLWYTPQASGTRPPVALRPASGGEPLTLFSAGGNAVQVFQYSAGQPAFVAHSTLTDPDGRPGFGTRLAVSGDLLLVAGQDGNSGYVRIFERHPQRYLRMRSR